MVEIKLYHFIKTIHLYSIPGIFIHILMLETKREGLNCDSIFKFIFSKWFCLVEKHK